MKETFVWWEDPIAGRVEWRYICMGNGELLLMMLLIYKMLMLFADSLAMTLDVRSQYIPHTINFYSALIIEFKCQ